jgi:hypothetical protein
VFRSSDGGGHWDVAMTPLRHDSAAAGIFSLAFGVSSHQVAVGGDYGKPADSRGNIAITSDGGRTWSEPAGAHPKGYRSAVAYLPFRKLWIAVGTSGTDTSSDNGQTWIPCDNTAYNAIGVTGRDTVWAVGPGGRIGKLQWP